MIECKHEKFVIVQTHNWIKPLANDSAWGLMCKKCKGVICEGYTKTELKTIN